MLAEVRTETAATAATRQRRSRAHLRRLLSAAANQVHTAAHNALPPSYRPYRPYLHTALTSPLYRLNAALIPPEYCLHIAVIPPSYRLHIAVIPPSYRLHTAFLPPSYSGRVATRQYSRRVAAYQELSIRQHTSAYVAAYVSIRLHT